MSGTRPPVHRSRVPALGPRGEGWVAIQVVLLAAAGVAGLLGPFWDGPVRVATLVLGSVAIATGSLLAFASARALRDALTPLPAPRAEGELVTSGPYARVRHPIYAALILATTGWALLTASGSAVVIAGVLALVLDLKSRREEVWLAERYSAYAAYRRGTRRLVPGLY